MADEPLLGSKLMGTSVRSEGLIGRAHALCADAQVQVAAARRTRAEIALARHHNPLRRVFMLARGGSSDGPFVETRVRRCPHCQSAAIKVAGHVVATEGLVKAMLRCGMCDELFFFVWKPLEFGCSDRPPAA